MVRQDRPAVTNPSLTGVAPLLTMQGAAACYFNAGGTVPDEALHAPPGRLYLFDHRRD